MTGAAFPLDLKEWPHPPCDTHSHIYPDAGDGQHNAASLQDYMRVARSLGVGRHVIVHSKAHRHDPQCTLDTVARIGLERARAVIWEEPRSGTTPTSSDCIARACVVCEPCYPAGVPVDAAALRNTAAKVAPLGWHLLVQAEGAAWPDCVDALNALPCPVVVDHIGRFGPDAGLDDSCVRVARALRAPRRVDQAGRSLLRHSGRGVRLRATRAAPSCASGRWGLTCDLGPELAARQSAPSTSAPTKLPRWNRCSR